MLLPFTEFQESLSPVSPTLIFLHGVFGRGKNFGQVARKLASTIQCLAFDLRNHGAAPSGVLNISAMAKDVIDTCLKLELENIFLLGHSLGGKVAMSAALEHQENTLWQERLKKLIIADIAPVPLRSPYGTMAADLARLEFPPLPTRRAGAEFLSKTIPTAKDPAVAAWLSQNILLETYPRWENNMAQIALDFDEIFRWPVEGSSLIPCQKPALFIKGGKSDHLPPESVGEIYRLFPKAEIETLPEAGHWVHAEDPETFSALVQTFLDKPLSASRIS